MQLSTSAVLTVNHVVQIIEEYYNNEEDWKKALDIAIPGRNRIVKQDEDDEEEEKS